MGGPPQGIGEGGWDAAAATSEAERPRDARRQRVLEGRRRLLGRVPRRLPPPGRRQRASGRRESRWRAGASRLAQVGRGAGRPLRGAWGAPRPSQAAGPPPPLLFRPHLDPAGHHRPGGQGASPRPRLPPPPPWQRPPGERLVSRNCDWLCSLPGGLGGGLQSYKLLEGRACGTK